MNIESFFSFSYGIYLVTSQHNDKKVAYIANTAFQVTAEPAQFAISCSKKNISTEVIIESGIFAISVLDNTADMRFVGKFGYKSGATSDKFAGTNTITAVTGAPIITDKAVAYLDCRVTQTIDVGTHFIIIGEVADAQVLNKDAEPLTYDYYRKVVKGLSPKNAPTYVDIKSLNK